MDLIDRQAAIDAIDEIESEVADGYGYQYEKWRKYFCELPSAQPEIIRCKDCKFYIPMNRKTKTGICRLLMHQNFGDDWYCAGAERRADE